MVQKPTWETTKTSLLSTFSTLWLFRRLWRRARPNESWPDHRSYIGGRTKLPDYTPLDSEDGRRWVCMGYTA